jgi:hypothetical protein
MVKENHKGLPNYRLKLTALAACAPSSLRYAATVRAAA